MKKEYIKPSVQVFELKSKYTIMAGSPTAPLGIHDASDEEEEYDGEFY